MHNFNTSNHSLLAEQIACFVCVALLLGFNHCTTEFQLSFMTLEVLYFFLQNNDFRRRKENPIFCSVSLQIVKWVLILFF